MNFVADGLYVEHSSFVGGWFFSGFRFFVVFKFAHKRAWLVKSFHNDIKFFERSHIELKPIHYNFPTKQQFLSSFPLLRRWKNG